MADSMKTWTEIEINKETHLIASQNVNERCTVILTNLKDVWLEELTVAEATEKCRKLNPFLVMEDFNFERVITHLFYNVSRSIVQPATREKIKLEMTLLGSTLQYEIDLKRGSARQVWKEVILPLCISVGQLMSQKRALIAEIRKRDAEISEYQCLNAEILTKNRVQPYSAEAIRGNMVMNSLNECLRVFTIVAHDPTVADAKEELFKKENIETNWPESEEREKAGSSKQETVVQSEDKGPNPKTESEANLLTTSKPMESKLTEGGDDNRSTAAEIDFFDSLIEDPIQSPSAKLRKIRKPRK